MKIEINRHKGRIYSYACDFICDLISTMATTTVQICALDQIGNTCERVFLDNTATNKILR